MKNIEYKIATIIGILIVLIIFVLVNQYIKRQEQNPSIERCVELCF